MNSLEEMKKIVAQLNKAAKAYYQEDREIMSNHEYDALYDKLLVLEKELGIILEDSPTKRVGYVVVSKLLKDKHEEPALSLDKTKDRTFLKDWLGDKEWVLSWKMDGLTIVATYDDGMLTKAVTRGNGEIGEIVTHNAQYFHGLPNTIPCDEDLGQINHNILWMTEQDETRCSERGLQPQLFYNFCPEPDGTGGHTMESKKLEKPRENGTFSTVQGVMKPDEEDRGVFPTKDTL